ncbi:hypothetical protein EV665_101617 [Shinella granuli]|uniref:Uncharacterized protein n=1 Tax=Shinella granuli TaxID=323621 RepID=A0A4R2D335_SHIGR|nr:hypothetical protein EV665_101617 [Shinella granuli]
MSPAMTNAATFYQQAVCTGTKIFATAPMIDWMA